MGRWRYIQGYQLLYSSILTTNIKLAAEITCTVFKPSSVLGADVISARLAAAGSCMLASICISKIEGKRTIDVTVVVVGEEDSGSVGRHFGKKNGYEVVLRCCRSPTQVNSRCKLKSRYSANKLGPHGQLFPSQ
jgi:hypothetical protein